MFVREPFFRMWWIVYKCIERISLGNGMLWSLDQTKPPWNYSAIDLKQVCRSWKYTIDRGISK